ncbi:lipoprotein insertase outer membrane protein LolB [Limnohabitans sp.]|uniref:lipoprotein insertase outer membrane protein LolB n=2 Tax=Limnohabitans sp. TaxID=1907725 RepID=UPI00286F18AD|nr:lipoprotein insertase outer membrane protein LolB [Limnohabitans sp.]
MRGVSAALFMASLMLVGCATPSRTPPPRSDEQTHAAEWQGRISVQVQGDAPSSMSASFLLRGDAKNGQLNLYSSLGTTLGALQWTPQWVQLSDGGKHQYFNSLAELTEKATGAALPIDALFGWLQGNDAQATGWQADLSAVPQGALTARRTSPAPEVTLRIKLDP